MENIKTEYQEKTPQKRPFLSVFRLIIILILLLAIGITSLIIISQDTTEKITSCPQNDSFSAQHNNTCVYYSETLEKFYYYKIYNESLRYWNICEVG